MGKNRRMAVVATDLDELSNAAYYADWYATIRSRSISSMNKIAVGSRLSFVDTSRYDLFLLFCLKTTFRKYEMATQMASVPNTNLRNLRIVASLTLATMILLGLSDARAQDIDKFKFSAGVFSVFKHDSSMSLTSTEVGLGVSFSPEDSLGWKGEQSVLRLDGRYRFTDKHSLSMSWYRISSDGDRSIQKDIEWLGRDGNVITIPVGASVKSSLEYDIVKLAYLWSFYHSDKVELSVGGGIHLTDIGVKLEASVTNNGVSASKADMIAPLPVVSLRLAYDVTPKFSWFWQAELFAISVGDWDGTYSDLQLGMEYQLLQNLGVGIGLGSNALKVLEETDKSRFNYDNRISGINFFVSGNF